MCGKGAGGGRGENGYLVKSKGLDRLHFAQHCLEPGAGRRLTGQAAQQPAGEGQPRQVRLPLPGAELAKPRGGHDTLPECYQLGGQRKIRNFSLFSHSNSAIF